MVIRNNGYRGRKEQSDQGRLVGLRVGVSYDLVAILDIYVHTGNTYLKEL